MSPTILLLLLAMVAFVAGVASVVIGGGRKDELTARSSATESDPQDLSFYDALGQRLVRTRVGRAVERRFENAALPIGPADYLLLNIVGVVVVVLVMSRILPLPFAIAAGVLAVWCGWLYVKRRERQRTQRFIDQLADVARILSGAAFAGLSVGAGIHIAGRELAEPAATEMRFVAERLSIGGTLDGAMEELRARVPSREVGVLISTLVIQQRAGGDTVRSLSDIAAVLEQRADTLREVQGILARPKGTTFALLGLAVFVLFGGNLLRPGSLREMLTDLVGLLAVGLAAALFAAGIFLSRRLGKIPDWYQDDADVDPETGMVRA